MIDDGTKKVDVFDLKLESDKKAYEDLINNPNVEVYREEFQYVKTGDPKITVFYFIAEQ